MNETKSNGLIPIIAQAIEIMEAKIGRPIPLNKINLAELGRLTGLSRGKLRTLKRKGFTEDINVNTAHEHIEVDKQNHVYIVDEYGDRGDDAEESKKAKDKADKK